MSDSFKLSGLRIISGEDTSLKASVMRSTAGIIEPFYAATMIIRNHCYDRGFFQSHDLGRPTLSVGNITTGGTGKTPVVQWIAARLRERGHHPAILLRGYGAAAGQPGDEAQLLDGSLNDGQDEKIPVQANQSRVHGAAEVLAQNPQIDIFVLDDAFQHRKARRDFNLVLISATHPFGFGHVLPRGLLREPLRGLARADAFLITRCSAVSPDTISEIDRMLARVHPSTPIYHADHHQCGLWLPQSQTTAPMESLVNERIYLAAAIGDPAAFEKQITAAAGTVVGSRWFADHHAYTSSEVTSLFTAARKASATRFITTAKDWVKIKSLAPRADLAVAIVQLEIHFHGDDESKLLQQIIPKLTRNGQN